MLAARLNYTRGPDAARAKTPEINQALNGLTGRQKALQSDKYCLYDGWRAPSIAYPGRHVIHQTRFFLNQSNLLLGETMQHAGQK